MLKTKEALYQKEALYHKIVFYYTLILAIYTLFGRFTWLHGLVEHTINQAAYAAAAMLGLLLIAIDFFVFQNYRKMKYFWIYILFIAVAAISSAINYRYGVISNLHTLGWLTVQMGLFTTMGHLFTKELYHKWLTLFFSISGGIWGFASAVSLYQYIFIKGYRIFMNGRLIRQSFYDNRLFGVFIDPNLGAFVAFLVMWGMFYLLYSRHKNQDCRSGIRYRAVSVLCILNCVIQLLYIILSGSRSTEICIIASLSFALIYALVWYYKNKKSFALPIRIISYLAVPFLCAFLILGSFSLFKNNVTGLAKQIAPEEHQQEDEFVRTDTGSDGSTNRLDIWKGYLYLWKDKPIFGLSPRNAWTYADQEHPDSYIAERHYDVHNAYIAVFAGMGLVGFAVLILMMFFILKTLKPRLFDTEKMSLQYFIALQLILNIAVFICFYPGIFFTNGIDTVLFWPALGFVMQHAVRSHAA